MKKKNNADVVFNLINILNYIILQRKKIKNQEYPS